MGKVLFFYDGSDACDNIYNRGLMMAILHDRNHYREGGNVELISLEQAPEARTRRSIPACSRNSSSTRITASAELRHRAYRVSNRHKHAPPRSCSASGRKSARVAIFL